MIYLVTFFLFTQAGKIGYCDLPAPQNFGELKSAIVATCDGVKNVDGAKLNQ